MQRAQDEAAHQQAPVLVCSLRILLANHWHIGPAGCFRLHQCWNTSDSKVSCDTEYSEPCMTATYIIVSILQDFSLGLDFCVSRHLNVTNKIVIASAWSRSHVSPSICLYVQKAYSQSSPANRSSINTFVSACCSTLSDLRTCHI
jgi:hypothetical protein